MGMDVYIDLVYLVNVVMGLFCILSLSVLTGKILSVKKMLGLSLLWGGHIITLYSDEWVYFLWILVICLLIDRKHIVRNCLLFLFLHETYLNSLKGVYRIGHVLILTTDFNWFLPLLFSLLLVFIYTCFWFQLRKEAQMQALFYEVSIKVDDCIYQGRGFMDTGNQAIYEGFPVILTQSKQFPVTQTAHLKFVVMNKEVRGIKAEILFQNQWKPCFIAYIDDLDVEADYLLNYYLM